LYENIKSLGDRTFLFGKGNPHVERRRVLYHASSRILDPFADDTECTVAELKELKFSRIATPSMIIEH